VTCQELNRISGAIIDAAVEVHLHLGPGLLESAYQSCLLHELRIRRFAVRSQLQLPLVYKGVQLDLGYRIDLLVEDAVVIETKCVEKILPVHEAQLLSYMRLSNKRLGLILNFKTARLKDGIKRMVNNL